MRHCMMNADSESENSNAASVNTTKSNGLNIQADRKYNAVLYGIPECPKGTKKFDRTKKDLTSVISTISPVVGEITPQSIRDCFRLGKYKESAERPRPILIKLTRAIDVINLLSNRSSLPDDISIKPDMTQTERSLSHYL